LEHKFATNPSEIASLGGRIESTLGRELDSAARYVNQWIYPHGDEDGLLGTYCGTARALCDEMTSHARKVQSALEAAGAELKKVSRYFAETEQELARELDFAYFIHQGGR
jgi:hypothetical protein